MPASHWVVYDAGAPECSVEERLGSVVCGRLGLRRLGDFGNLSVVLDLFAWFGRLLAQPRRPPLHLDVHMKDPFADLGRGSGVDSVRDLESSGSAPCVEPRLKCRQNDLGLVLGAIDDYPHTVRILRDAHEPNGLVLAESASRQQRGN